VREKKERKRVRQGEKRNWASCLEWFKTFLGVAGSLSPSFSSLSVTRFVGGNRKSFGWKRVMADGVIRLCSRRAALSCPFYDTTGKMCSFYNWYCSKNNSMLSKPLITIWDNVKGRPPYQHCVCVCVRVSSFSQNACSHIYLGGTVWVSGCALCVIVSDDTSGSFVSLWPQPHTLMHTHRSWLLCWPSEVIGASFPASCSAFIAWLLCHIARDSAKSLQLCLPFLLKSLLSNSSLVGN